MYLYIYYYKTLLSTRRLGSLGSGNPRPQRSGAVGEARYNSCRIDNSAEKKGIEVEGALLPRWGQRDEGGEKERIMTRVDGQDSSDWRKTGGETQESIFCTHASRRH